MDLFTYGSLMLPEVLEQVTGRSFSMTPARLPGWKRCQVRGQSYPAMIPCHGQTVEGVLWLGLSDTELQLLDTFEGDEYQRVPVTVTDDEGHDYQAQTYAWAKQGGLLDAPWDLEWFKLEGIKDFSRLYFRSR
jgi:gamma-glutamylcyclotransferase (GGCT)/AIG2-like uncharacterized protein YtfP